MQKQDSVTQASEYLRQTIPMLSRHGLKPTPLNYAVFYSYISGESQALKERIKNIIDQKQSFSATLMNDLHEKYLGGGVVFAAQEGVQQGLKKIILEFSEGIKIINDGTQEFDTSLVSHSEELSSTSDSDATKMILQQIMQDTRAMSKSAQAAQEKMEETNLEINRIKEELEAVKKTAEEDALTGLKNRGAFDSFIYQVVHESNRSTTPHLIMLDIDHFKRINDNFGHLVGDRVIRYISALMRQIIGEEHHIARYGGEEFAIVINNKSLDETLQLTEKIRIAMSNSKLQRKDSGETIGQVTVSAGISTLQNGDTIDSFIDRADKALYNAKETGRNKVITANS
ncbi:MAG: diguanylate cyclase [Piscirickettsiaceae bacterium]|nr:MAG: diguanylate cyclase [Piscirickettsiaceae bacterium]